MDCYIVSLGNASHIVSQVDPFYINGVSVVGVDGRKLTAAEYFLRIGKQKKIMTPGEVGCALSHLSIYDTIIASNKGGYDLVLEDDVQVPSDFYKQVAAISCRQGLNYDIVILGGQDGIFDRYYLWGKKDASGIFEVSPFFASRLWRTCAYLVSRSGAEIISTAQKNGLKPADSWGKWSRQAGLRIGFINISSHPTDLSMSIIESDRLAVRSVVWHKSIFIVHCVRAVRFLFFLFMGVVSLRRPLFKWWIK